MPKTVKNKISMTKISTPKCKVRRKFFQYTAETLKQAIFEIHENNPSICKASSLFGVPKTTIIDHMKGRSRGNSERTGPEPLFTKAVEDEIYSWVINIAKCGFPIKKNDLKRQKVAKDLGKSKLFRNGKPGERWYANFLRRYPAICLRKAEGVNKGRAVITEECIRRWFQELQKNLEDNNSSDVMEDPSRIFNADESGFSPKMGKVLAPKGWKNLFNIKLGADKENITVLVTFSANGNVALPVVVFPYVHHPYAVVKSMSTDWVLGESDSG